MTRGIFESPMERHAVSFWMQITSAGLILLLASGNNLHVDSTISRFPFKMDCFKNMYLLLCRGGEKTASEDL